MESLKEKILTEGEAIGTEIVKVDGFLNHQIDVKFLEEIGEEFKRRFDDIEVDKILTVEASGIAIACMAAPLFGYPPVVFAKKAAPSTMNEGFYEAEAKSFTKGTISKLKVAKSGSGYQIQFGAMKYTTDGGTNSPTYDGTAFSYTGPVAKGLSIQ